MLSLLKVKDSHIKYYLSGLTLLLLIVAFSTHQIVFFSFLALSPLFGLYDLKKNKEVTGIQFVLLVSIPLIVSYSGSVVISGDETFCISIKISSLCYFNGIVLYNFLRSLTVMPGIESDILPS